MAGLRLRKFVTNSDELLCLIQLNEGYLKNGGAEIVTNIERDHSYAKASLGVKMDEEQGVHKILGVEWDKM